MRFLRLLLNALVCGLYFSLLLALLVLVLNVNHVLRPLDIPRLALFLFPTYGLLTALLCMLTASIYRFFVTQPPRRGLFSPTFLSFGFSLLTLLFLAIFRENTTHFASFFVPEVKTLVEIQMIVLFAAAAAGLVLLFYYYHRRRRPAYLTLFLGLTAAAAAAAVGLRAGFPEFSKTTPFASMEPKKIERRVTVLNLEGLDFEFIVPLVAERKLPNFAWLMENGAWGHLAGFTPSDPPVLRRTLRTGKLPGRHRRFSNIHYGIPFFDGRLEIVPRFILFRQFTRVGLLDISPHEPAPAVKDIETIYGEELAVVVRSEEPLPPSPEIPVPEPRTEKLFLSIYKDLQFETSAVAARLREALDRDGLAEERAFAAKAETQPQLFVLTLDGLSEVQSYFYKYSLPESFGDILPDEIQKFGTVIERYYQYYDRIISKTVAAMKEGELLIVCSPYGTEPLPYWKRLIEWMLGNPDVSAYHERAPDGVLFVYGLGVTKGRNADGIRLADIAPTLLYFAGLPVARDMDGYVRTTLFTREFKDQNPILTISSYEDVSVRKRP